MDALRLLPLSPELIPEIEKYRAEYPETLLRVTPDPERIPGLDGLEDHENAADWLRYCETQKGKISWFAAVRINDGKVIGSCCLRHKLEYDDDDPEFRSHIGYSIRPSEQRKGYGKEQLRLALQKAKALGIERVRIICSDENEGSASVIRANGGVFVGAIRGEESELTVNRYDIDLQAL